jgi:anti-sigma regulatory factor (Ser/Thr protein kinase)
MRIEHPSAVGTARRAAAALADRLGLGESRVHEIELVVSEVADNQLKHAGGGRLLLRAFRSTAGPGLGLVAVDGGPGIADLDSATRDGHSTAGSLGIGLGAVLRLCDTWDAHTALGRGTVLSVGFGNCATVDGTGPGDGGGLTRPMTGQEACGDAWAVRRDGATVTGLLVDGLGHGPLAASAAQTAVRAFVDADAAPPAELLARIHRALQGTRGAAVALAQISEASELSYAGIGNIAGHLLGDERPRRLTSFPGIVGGAARTPREIAYRLESDTVVVLHTDGISEKVKLDAASGILRRTPTVIGATVLRDHGVRNDDAGVLVLRPGAEP